eukprot:6191224-Pleurochrysis_carterae.AAC.1
MLDLQKFVSNRFGFQSLVDVYYLVAPSQGRECNLSQQDIQVLTAIGTNFTTSWPKLFEFSPRQCSHFYSVNHMGEYVRNFTMAGYEHGKSVEVLYMESWTSAGANMTQRIMRLLHLSTRDYKWRKTNNFQPIYS